jgi:signal transduction histidine kinase
MSKPSILGDVPDIVQETIQRALRNIARLSDEKQDYQRIDAGTRFDDELDAAMAPDQELLAEFRRMCARKGIDADAVIAFLSKND